MGSIFAIKVSSQLETADDGDACHFGGTFTVTTKENAADDICEYYFRGNDRYTTPGKIVLERIYTLYGATEGEYDEDVPIGQLEYMLSDAIYNQETVLLLIDENNIITQIEPV